MGPYGRRIINQWHRKLRDHCTRWTEQALDHVQCRALALALLNLWVQLQTVKEKQSVDPNIWLPASSLHSHHSSL
jgi:hypothetical protein